MGKTILKGQNITFGFGLRVAVFAMYMLTLIKLRLFRQDKELVVSVFHV